MEEWERRRLEATVQAAALCAYVDGHLAPEERLKVCECIATFASSESEARRLLNFAKQLPEWIAMPESGFRARQLAEIKEALRTRQEREYAFELAVKVAHAHQGICVFETSFLVNLMFELNIDGGVAKALLDRTRAES